MLWYNYLVNKSRKAEELALYRNLYISDVHYVRAALEEKLGRPIDLETVHAALKAEGMLPWEEYGVPKWYVDKWFPNPRSPSAAEENSVG
jgi:hypothetical protein